MHAIIIIHETCSVKVGLNTKLALLGSKSTSHLIYDTKILKTIIQLIIN
jgi:hypothetical protein